MNCLGSYNLLLRDQSFTYGEHTAAWETALRDYLAQPSSVIHANARTHQWRKRSRAQGPSGQEVQDTIGDCHLKDSSVWEDGSLLRPLGVHKQQVFGVLEVQS
jgi:hypothetical protein